MQCVEVVLLLCRYIASVAKCKLHAACLPWLLFYKTQLQLLPLLLV